LACDRCRKKIDKCNEVIIFHDLNNSELHEPIVRVVEETVNKNNQDLEIGVRF